MYAMFSKFQTDFITVGLICLVWLWFTCGPMVKSEKTWRERLEFQIAALFPLIGISFMAIAVLGGTKGTVVEKFIVDNIYNFEFTTMTVVNLFLCLTGVTAIALSQSSNKTVTKYASVFGMIGQPAWYALAILTNNIGLLILSTLYTQAWWRGFNDNWVKPWLFNRRMMKLGISSIPATIYHACTEPTDSPKIGDAWVSGTDHYKRVWDGQAWVLTVPYVDKAKRV